MYGLTVIQEQRFLRLSLGVHIRVFVVGSRKDRPVRENLRQRQDG
jgi:hypothetical protein